ncbi:MAG TPA: acetate kinase [Oligoflexus sp.]|uniref:acetate/propionate family kinase n=1 Tax=Oligoflexus sp. TaxID=1971216 RepID=UPI002D7E98BB|nr:acetate kinase [Oligoflexus sp.]HET9240879.1 acetate kinase [Oligoflexus sp.]
MNILVINCGSSSLKFQLIDMEEKSEQALAQGVVERIGGEALLTLRSGARRIRKTAPVRKQRDALALVLEWLVSPEAGGPVIPSLASIHAVGHRVVHGGEKFRASVRINAKVMTGLEDCIDLAPIHNPANINGIRAVQEILGTEIPQIAVFDTSFHLTMPEPAWMYAIPYSLYRRHKVRRYGFHGTSCRFVAQRYREITGRTEAQTNLILFHLGNGCSVTAIIGGLSVDTSMGMTPLEGLMMGTRSGDIDPAVLELIADKEGMNIHEMEALLNKQSGLLGVSGLTHDMRDLLEEVQDNGDRRAQLAIDMFCYRARKYLGAYLVATGGVDAIVFTGGIGENADVVREQILRGLHRFGIEVDPEKNKETVGSREGRISKDGLSPEVWVIPTNEELMIARDVLQLVSG